MKRLKYALIATLVIAALATGLGSCSDDDCPYSQEQIVGVWENTYYTFREEKNGKVTYREKTQQDGSFRIRYDEDSYRYESYKSGGVWSEWKAMGIWQLAGETLHQIVGDEVYSYRITVLSPDCMELEYCNSTSVENGNTYKTFRINTFRKVNE